MTIQDKFFTVWNDFIQEAHVMGEYRCERLFLQGRIKIIIDPTEFRMALWINGFGVSDAITGNEIIPVCYSYNLEHAEETEDSLEIDFRIYPEGHVYYHVSINPFDKIFTYKGLVYSTDDFRNIIEAARKNSSANT